MEATNSPPEDVSREHVDHVLRRERRDMERLADRLGSDVVGKLDRLLARDLIHDYRDRALAEAFGASAEEQPAPVHRVMVQLASGRPTHRMRPPSEPEGRRKHIAGMQRSGGRAVERLEKDLSGRDARVTQSFWLNHSAAVEAPGDEVVHLAGRGDVSGVSAVKEQFALALDVSRPLIQADQVETARAITGRGVRVAVIDTGVDTTHPALAGVVATQTDMTGASGLVPEGVGDMVGHGTHCAGIVASQDGTRRGIAPGATIDDIKIMWSPGTTDNVVAVAGIQAAVNAGVDVATNSWGFSHANGAWADPPSAGAPDGTCVLCSAADAAVAAGVVFVVAAGNEDNDSCSTYDTHLRCPGLAANAITVAASTDSDSMADFSSIGPTPDGRAKPDVTAPGQEIASCRATGTSLGSPIDALWTNADGTSMATPHVAGVAALMLQKNPALTPANVKGALMTTAVNIGATANEMGAGRVDALAAVDSV
jgi:serine protease AprX